MNLIKCEEHFDSVKGIMVGIDMDDNAPDGRVILSAGHGVIHLTIAEALLLKQNLSERIVLARRLVEI